MAKLAIFHDLKRFPDPKWHAIQVIAIQPTLVRWFYLGWMIVVFPIGWCISPLLLASVFGLLVLPLGILIRCLGIDPLSRGFDPKRSSYWTRRDPMPPISRYFRQF